VEYVVDFVRSNGGIQYAEQRALEYGNAARECLKPFPETDARRSLELFVDFVMEREK
jgi:octaprenyl-diphosphate synthase